METDSVNDEIVFRQDNPDYAAYEADRDAFNANLESIGLVTEVAFGSELKRTLNSTQLDKEAELTEIARLKLDLMNVLSENQSLKAVNSKLIER